jgi:putative oxidoreductase
MEFTWLSRWQPQLLAILRIVTALLFVEHATMKFFHFPAPLMPGPLPPLLLAAGVIEIVTSVLILLGLYTRIAAFIASGEMAVAYFMFHFPKGFWPTLNMGESAILFCFIFLYLAAAGAGPWSIDAARTRSAPIT